MAITQAPADVAVAARLFHALADRTRMSVLLRLLDGERRVTDLVAEVGGSQSNISAHLSCLRECGLVVSRPAGRRQVFYSIAHDEIRQLLLASEAVLAAAGTTIDLCRSPMMGHEQ